MLGGCGRATKIYVDPAKPTEPAIVGQANRLPRKFFDQSVNLGSVTIGLDGATATSLALRFELKPGTSTDGSYNGAGQGNTALLGLAGYSGRKLSDIGEINFDSKSTAGGERVSLQILVDLECDGVSSTKLLRADASDLGAGTPTSDGYSRISASFSESVWLASSADVSNHASTTVLVPATGAAVSLSGLISEYPNACLRNSLNADDRLPKNTAVSALTLALGSPSESAASIVFVRRATVDDDVFDHTSWDEL